MNTILLAAFLAAAPTINLSPQPPPVTCEEVSKRAEETFRKLDDALKLKAGMLLGEMETAKSALQGCIDRNEAVSTQMAFIWFAGDIGLLAVLPLLYFHQRRMQRAISLLSGLFKSKEPAHAVRYSPSSALYLWAISLLLIGFLGLNIVALLL